MNNMLRAIMKRVGNMQEQLHNTSKEMKTLRKSKKVVETKNNTVTKN